MSSRRPVVRAPVPSERKGSARSPLRFLALLAVITILFTACGPGGPPAEPRPVTLAMGYIPDVQFAPFYVAVDKGYFAGEGIEIEFDYGWETDLLKLVGSDELQFAIASGDQVLLARSQGLPVVYVMNWYRRFPVCVVSLPGTGIRSPADLAGRRVGTPALYGASYIGWRALLESAGLNEADAELVSIGYTQAAALTEGQVDAAICYAMNEPVQLEVSGQPVDVIYVADYANLVSNGLITNDTTVRERPELVQSLVRAALRGLAYTMEHPDEAFEISARYVPGLDADAGAAALGQAVLARSIDFWQVGDGLLGESRAGDWQVSQEVMRAMGLVGALDDPDALYTNRFVEEGQP